MFSSSSSTKKIEDQLFNLKMMIKVLKSNSNKNKNKYKSSIKQIKKLVNEGDNESAEMLAAHAVEQRKLQLRYMKMSLKLDLISSKIQSALETKHSTTDITKLVKTCSMMNNPTEIVNQIDEFEQLFDDINISSAVVDDALDQSTAMDSGSKNEVTTLLDKVKDSIAVEQSSNLPLLSTGETVSDILKNSKIK